MMSILPATLLFRRHFVGANAPGGVLEKGCKERVRSESDLSKLRSKEVHTPQVSVGHYVEKTLW
jgi:hypothetical protein